MFTIAFESQFACSVVLPVAEGTADATAAAQATPTVYVIAATILVALTLRTATRAVVSIVSRIARSAPASMMGLVLLATAAIVVAQR